MNETLTTILSRRSCRSFIDRPIEKSVLERIAAAGKFAPTARSAQTRIVTVLTEPARITQAYTCVRHAAGRDDSYDMYRPKALILFSDDRADGNGLANCACCAQNSMLAATSLGVGSVWINQFKMVCDDAEVRAFLDTLSIPQSHIVWSAVALGYPAAAPEEKSKDGLLVQWF